MIISSIPFPIFIPVNEHIDQNHSSNQPQPEQWPKSELIKTADGLFMKTTAESEKKTLKKIE